MKKLLKKLSIILSFSIVFSSCVKEKFAVKYDETNLARPIVEIADAPTNKISSASVDVTQAFVELDLGEIRVAPRSQFSGNIDIVLKQDPAVVTQFVNAQNPVPTISALPNTAFTIVKTAFSYNAGIRTDRLKVRINTSFISYTSRNAIGITIQSATGAEISNLYKSVVVELTPRNTWEATYIATGTRINYNGPTVASGIASTLVIDETKYLKTISPTQVDGFMGDLAFVPFYYTLQINSTTNAVNVIASVANPLDTPPTVGANGSSSYNPATKTFT